MDLFLALLKAFLVGGAMILNGHIYLRQKISETERGIRAMNSSLCVQQ